MRKFSRKFPAASALAIPRSIASKSLLLTTAPLVVASFMAALLGGCGESDTSSSNSNNSNNSNVAPGESPAPNPAPLDNGGACPSYRPLVEVSATSLFDSESTPVTGAMDYLRLDDTHAYWFSDLNTYYRAPLAGGEPEPLLRLEAENTLWTDTVLYGDYLFFRDGDDLIRLPKAGGEAEVFVSFSAFSSSSTLRTMVVDGATLYAVSLGSITCGASSSVVAISLEDATIEILTEELRCPDDIAMDADFIYVSEAGPIDSGDYKHHEPAVVKIPKSGGEPVVLETGTRVTRLRTDGGGYVFGLVGGQEYAGTALVRIPKAGGAVESLVGEDCGFDSDMLEIVDGNLVFADYSNLVVMSPSGEVVKSIHDETHSLPTGHELIAVQGNRVVVYDRDIVTFTLP